MLEPKNFLKRDLYEKGLAVEQNLQKALELLEMAEKNGKDESESIERVKALIQEQNKYLSRKRKTR